MTNAITTGGATSGQEKNVSLGPAQVVEAIGVGANGTLAMPPRSMLLSIGIYNTTANAITDGLDIGTTAAGTDVVSAVAVAANANKIATPSIYFFPTGATLYYTAHTSWNSASINLIVAYVLY